MCVCAGFGGLLEGFVKFRAYGDVAYFCRVRFLACDGADFHGAACVFGLLSPSVRGGCSRSASYGL